MIYVISSVFAARRGRAREGVIPHRAQLSVYLYLRRLRRETRTSPRGVKPNRAQNKPFHGLRIVFWAPENAPPPVGVIVTGGTTRRPGVFREFFNGN